MLKLTKVTLHNICQYDEAEFDLQTGLTAVCGRNGSGKTNLFRAIMYGLTGSVDGNWGSQTDLQKDNSLDPGYVEVELVQNLSQQYKIRRYTVSGNKFPDTIAGAVEVKGRRDVNASLAELYGVSCSLLFTLCWGRQGALGELLKSTAADVNTFLREVFDLMHMEGLRKYLREAVTTIASYPASITTDSVEKLQQELKEIPTDKALDAELSEAVETKNALKASLGDLSSKASGRLGSAVFRARKAALDAKIASLEKALEDYASCTVPDQPQTSKEALTTEQTDLQKTAAAITADIAETTHDVAALKSAVSSATKEAEDLRTSTADRVRAYSDALNNNSHCSVCGAPVQDLEAYKKHLAETLFGYPSTEELLNSTNKKLAELQEDIESSNEQLTAEEANLKSMQTSLDTVQNRLQEVQEQWHLWYLVDKAMLNNKEHDQLQESLMLNKQALEDLEKQQPLTEEEEKELSAENEALAYIENKLLEMTAEIAAAVEKRKFLQAQIAETTKLLEQADINNSVRNCLNEIRDAFSATRAQARFLEAKITEINNRLAVFMQQTGMPFSLQLNAETHRFEFTTTAGITHPAAHLSGAQEAISAVAVQMVLLEVVHPNINLYLVDEPAEALDDQNKAIMAEQFQKMARTLPAVEGEMLIITRDMQMLEACNNVIEVSRE